MLVERNGFKRNTVVFSSQLSRTIGICRLSTGSPTGGSNHALSLPTARCGAGLAQGRGAPAGTIARYCYCARATPLCNDAKLYKPLKTEASPTRLLRVARPSVPGPLSTVASLYKPH